jgi:hypothetical protein
MTTIAKSFVQETSYPRAEWITRCLHLANIEENPYWVAADGNCAIYAILEAVGFRVGFLSEDLAFRLAAKLRVDLPQNSEEMKIQFGEVSPSAVQTWLPQFNARASFDLPFWEETNLIMFESRLGYAVDVISLVDVPRTRESKMFNQLRNPTWNTRCKVLLDMSTAHYWGLRSQQLLTWTLSDADAIAVLNQTSMVEVLQDWFLLLDESAKLANPGGRVLHFLDFRHRVATVRASREPNNNTVVRGD